MRKSTIFISSVLTTFALVILFGVVKAYQSNAVLQAAEVQVQQPVATQVVPTDTPVPTPTIITPEEAAQVAAQVVGHDNLLSAETSNFNGVPAYLVTFTNKDVVYVGMDGQVLSVQIAPVVVNVVAPQTNNNNQGGNNNQSSHSSEGEHESHDD
jgi:uncharacterized membrane protein YkoI